MALGPQQLAQRGSYDSLRTPADLTIAAEIVHATTPRIAMTATKGSHSRTSVPRFTSKADNGELPDEQPRRHRRREHACGSHDCSAPAQSFPTLENQSDAGDDAGVTGRSRLR